MDEAKTRVIKQRMERTAQALRKNNMEAHCVAKAADVLPLVRTLLQKGDVVAAGGSISLSETGIMDLLDNGDYHYLNRMTPGLSGEEIGKIYREVFSADCYFASSNAVTEQGELYNVDGNANRVAALTFGPKRVILVVGYNKIVPYLAAAKLRVERIAAPSNTVRLACKTPCAVTGVCVDCNSQGRICCTYVIHKYQRIAGRIHVILVGEELGY